MKLVVTMKWNERQQKWLMLNADGRFIYDFWDCPTVNQAFHGLDKKSPRSYEISIKAESQAEA